MEERLRKVMRFWGIKRAPLPQIIKDEELLRSLDKNAGALFLPKERTIILPNSGENLEAEFTHWLRYVRVGEKIHTYKPVEEMLEHITMRALNLRNALTEREKKTLELVSIKTLDTLTGAYIQIKNARRTLEKRGNKELVRMLKNYEENIKQIIQNIVLGKNFEFGTAYLDLETAVNVARMFLNKKPLNLGGTEIAIDALSSNVQTLVEHWPYIIAEDVVGKIKKMSVKERRKFFEQAHTEFYKLALDYIRKRSPKLAETLAEIVLPPKISLGEHVLQRLRMYKELLKAYARQRVIKA